MAIKILILGGSGMAGHMVHYYLRSCRKFVVHSTFFTNPSKFTTKQLDVYNSGSIREIVESNRPQFVINCIGALIRQSKSDVASSIYLNSYLPHLLREICDNSGCTLVHLSTDCVFSGSKGNYNEWDLTDAQDVYGKSKSLGEFNVDRHLTIRTSIIGPEIKATPEGLFSWFMAQHGTIEGYSKAFWSGVTTLQLAKSIETAIDHNARGLLHLTNGIRISKFELLSILKQVFQKSDIEIIPNTDYVVDKSLACSKKFDFKVPDYNQMVREMKEVMISADYIKFIS